MTGQPNRVPGLAGAAVAAAASSEPRSAAQQLTYVADSSLSPGAQKLCPVCNARHPASYRVCPIDSAELIDDDDLVGTVLGGTYQIVRILGEGGMGRVYEARHARIGSKRFAIKTLHPEFARQTEVLARFRREAEATAAIESPHVVGIYDVHQAPDGRPFLVVEFLQGKDLADHLAKVGRLAYPRAVRIVRQICRALDAAHAKGIVHRDMKPENVFLTGDPDQPLAKVIDFGISRLDDQPGGKSLTKTGMIMGTPAYMAPEQARGERVDHRADIYAVGAILYSVLTGRRPFEKDEPSAAIVAVLTEDPPRPRSLEPSIPEALEMVVQRAMAKQPDARPQTIAELDAALAPFDSAAGPDELLSVSSLALSASAVTSQTPARIAAATSLRRQERELAMARPLVAALGALAALGLAIGLASMTAAIVRLARGGSPRAGLTGLEAVLIVLGIGFALLTPALLAVHHVRRSVWANTAKVVELLRALRGPVAVGLGAYGFTSLLVRFFESVVWRRAVGVAWPAWDVLLFFVAAAAAAGAALWARDRR